MALIYTASSAAGKSIIVSSPKLWVQFLGRPHNQNCNILGSELGSACFGKLANNPCNTSQLYTFQLDIDIVEGPRPMATRHLVS